MNWTQNFRLHITENLAGLSHKKTCRFVIPNSTNTWQSLIEAAPESQMMPAKVRNIHVGCRWCWILVAAEVTRSVLLPHADGLSRAGAQRQCCDRDSVLWWGLASQYKQGTATHTHCSYPVQNESKKLLVSTSRQQIKHSRKLCFRFASTTFENCKRCFRGST